MNSAIAYTPATGMPLPKLPPRSSSWRSMAPSAAPPKKPEVDIASYVAFPCLTSGGGSSAKAPFLAATGSKLDFKKAAAAAPAIAPPTSVPTDTRISIKPSTIAVKVQKSPYAEEYEDDGWPSEEEDEEFNANIVSDRRRGDKGFW